MSDPSCPLLSVRGDARRTVAPDYATLSSRVTVSLPSKAAALQATGLALERLTADLTSLGGVPLTVDTERHALTWSAQSATSSPEHEHDKQTGRYGPTGRVTVSAAVLITVRAFDRLDALGTILATHDAVAVYQVGWHVDPDNPGWPEVRGAAIHSAIRRGRDYAAALGGTLHNVEHIADVGLLGGGNEAARYGAGYTGGYSDWAQPLSGPDGEHPDTPALDPVPQGLTATIEARFTTAGVSLAEQ